MPSDNVYDLRVVENVNILPEITSIVEDALVDSGTSIMNEINVSFDSTSNDVDEIVESNISTEPSKSFEFPCADYEFMVFPAELFSSESSEFFAMIQLMIFGVSSFIGCLEFVPKSSIPPLEWLEVCPPRHHVYIICASIRVMPRVSTALHLFVAHDDNLTRQIAICNDNYKFVAYSCSFL